MYRFIYERFPGASSGYVYVCVCVLCTRMYVFTCTQGQAYDVLSVYVNIDGNKEIDVVSSFPSF